MTSGLPKNSFEGLADSGGGTSRRDRAWVWMLSASLALVVCIRFFSEDLRLLPALVQYLDVPLTAAIAFLAFLRFLRTGHHPTGSRFGVILYVFLLVCLVSAVANTSRVELLPMGFFIFNFAAPLVFLLVTVSVGLKREQVNLVVRMFFWLGVLQLAICAVYSLPRFLATGNPDYVSGTFGHNAYQFTFFIGLWLLYVIGGTVAGSGPRRTGQSVVVTLAVVAVFGLFYAAQYRAMLVFFTLVILVTVLVCPARVSRRAVLTFTVSAVSVVTLVVVATAFPNLKLLNVFDLLQDTSPIVESGKVQAAKNVVAMYEDLPQAAFVGSGPATFSSRAYIVFASKPLPQREAVGALAVGMRGGRMYKTDVAQKYVDTIPFKPIQGGTTVSSPNSSFTSLAAETGLLGLGVYLTAYFSALVYAFRRMGHCVRAGDGRGGRLAFMCFGGILLLLVQALFDNWLETTRVSIPLWIMVGLLYSLGNADRTETLRAEPMTLIEIDSSAENSGEHASGSHT